MKRCLSRVFLGATVLFLAGCFPFPDIIRDVREFPQDHRVYTARYASVFNQVTDEDQHRMDRQYDSRFFSPWHLEKSAHPLDEAVFEFKKYRASPGYGENGRKHTRAWMKSLAANAHLEDYPNGGFMAITVDNTDFRVVPTLKPRFNTFEHVEGYPFDYFQNSGIGVNTPVYVSHVSRDKAWYLAESSFAFGWIPSRNVARVDQTFMRSWETGRYAVIIKDKMPLADEEGRFLFKPPLGSVFPVTGEDARGIHLLVAVADTRGNAVVRNVSVSPAVAALKPLKLNAANMALLANELINEPYGWGGMYQNRDCSSMTRDLFAPFGLWLPRNSSKQAKQGGLFVNLANLSPAQKEALILKRGIPYLTLIWRPGHIMLYIGDHDGKALVFHNLWSIKTRDMLGRKGKKVVGHAAVTTLRPGRELRIVALPGDDLLDRVAGMTLLTEPPEAVEASGSGTNP